MNSKQIAENTAAPAGTINTRLRRRIPQSIAAARTSGAIPNATTFVQADTAQTKAVSANLRLRYTFRPDSDLYVIYNIGNRFQALAAGNPMEVREEKFAVKVTYSWSR